MERPAITPTRPAPYPGLPVCAAAIQSVPHPIPPQPLFSFMSSRGSGNPRGMSPLLPSQASPTPRFQLLLPKQTSPTLNLFAPVGIIHRARLFPDLVHMRRTGVVALPSLVCPHPSPCSPAEVAILQRNPPLFPCWLCLLPFLFSGWLDAAVPSGTGNLTSAFHIVH